MAPCIKCVAISTVGLRGTKSQTRPPPVACATLQIPTLFCTRHLFPDDPYLKHRFPGKHTSQYLPTRLAITPSVIWGSYFLNLKSRHETCIHGDKRSVWILSCLRKSASYRCCSYRMAEPERSEILFGGRLRNLVFISISMHCWAKSIQQRRRKGTRTAIRRNQKSSENSKRREETETSYKDAQCSVIREALAIFLSFSSFQ